MKLKKKNILIIKHGALGDFILSFGPFKAIRNYHLNDNVYLLLMLCESDPIVCSKYSKY